ARVSPGSANAIPGLVSAWLDARGGDAGAVRALVAELAESSGAEVGEESWTPAVDFDAALRDRLASAAGTTGAGPVPVLPTGAGHDAGILAAAGVPSAMVFVRNPTGISHSPEEHAETSDCHLGVAALAATLEELCRS
ncbi:M20/M25/M40 family metallo-hydrolase, partial [Planomonospora algeriensis]